MTIDDQKKVKEAGFTIIRKGENPVPMIKMSVGENGGWAILEKFRTKAARDRAFSQMLLDPKTISD